MNYLILFVSVSSLIVLYILRNFINKDSSAQSSQSPPTFEDLNIDDKLPELERVVRYVKSNIGLQRLVESYWNNVISISICYVFKLTN